MDPCSELAVKEIEVVQDVNFALAHSVVDKTRLELDTNVPARRSVHT
jgi:hypothetical protein